MWSKGIYPLVTAFVALIFFPQAVDIIGDLFAFIWISGLVFWYLIKRTSTLSTLSTQWMKASSHHVLRPETYHVLNHRHFKCLAL